MKKSTFKLVTGETFPTSVTNFLKEANYSYAGTGLLNVWVKGDLETSKDLVLVVINNEDNEILNDVIYRSPEGTIVIEGCESMYQTFLAHKAARFLELPVTTALDNETAEALAA
jgi:hypothetical protein